MKRNTAQLKEQLIQTGIDEIGKHGIEQLSLRTVAKACGVTHGTPYRHFESKEGYLKVVLARLSLFLNQEINENIEMVEKLINDGNFPIYFSVSIRVVASSPDLLEESVKAIDKDVKQFNIKFRDGIHQPLEMFNLTAPICQNYVENYMLETTADTMGYMYPFVYEALYDSTEEIDKDSKEVLYRYPPVYIGNTKNTNGVVFYDNFVRKGDRTNSNEFIVGTPKSNNSYRRIYINKLLKKIINHNLKSDLLFSINDSYIHYANVRSRLKTILKNTPYHNLTIHDLRHIHSSLLLYNKVDLKSISTHLGHSSIRITSDIYLHTAHEASEQLSINIENIFNNLKK